MHKFDLKGTSKEVKTEAAENPIDQKAALDAFKASVFAAVGLSPDGKSGSPAARAKKAKELHRGREIKNSATPTHPKRKGK